MKNFFWRNDRGFVWLLVTLLFVIVATQFYSGASFANVLLVRTGLYLVMVASVASSTLSLTRKRFGYALAVVLLALALLVEHRSSQTLQFVYFIITALYLIVILFVIVKHILDGERINRNKIIGGIAAYLLLAQVWTYLYMIVYLVNERSFYFAGAPIAKDVMQHLSYFSFITLTTTGYGDVTAFSPTAKTFAIFESLIGQLFPVIFIARLVSSHINDSKRDANKIAQENKS